MRNPYTRTYSYYKHFQKINNVKLSFYDFLNYVKFRGNYILYKNYYNRTPMVLYEQSFYIKDKLYNIGKLNKIYKFENLQEFEKDFDTKLLILNKGEYDQDDFYRDYGFNEIELVKNIYNEDFINFNYNKNFTQI